MINVMYIQDFESLLSRKDSKNSAFKDLEIIFWFVFEKKCIIMMEMSYTT